MGFSADDKKWQGYNKKLRKLIRAKDFFGLGTTYYEMAVFVEKEGGDPKMYRDLGYRMLIQDGTSSRTLQSYLDSGVVSLVVILNALDSCDVCKKLNGKRFNVKEAIKNTPIPAKQCTHIQGCRCVYLPEVKEF